MRRPVQPLPISPKLLKHFAAATVVLTALAALFAGGEQSQIAQEFAERQARNQLAQTEAKTVGSREVADTDAPRRTAGSWGSAGPDDPGFSGASTDPNPPPMMATNAPKGRQIGPNRGRPNLLAPPEGDDASPREPNEPTSPTADQAAALLQSSMARSGGSGDGD